MIRIACRASLIALALAASAAHAGYCVIGPLQSNDKTLHLVGEAAVVAGTTYLTQDWRYGVGLAFAAGAAREIYKHRTPGESCEWSSMAYDLVGIGIGAYLGHHFFVVPQKGGVVVGYSREF